MKNKMEKNKEKILDNYREEEFVFADGFDDAIIGIASGIDTRVCYDRKKVLKKLQEDGMSEEEAFEYFDYNIGGAYIGEKTPIFIDLLNNMM